jgi:ABC-type sugar transport system substrate-binding protein
VREGVAAIGASVEDAAVVSPALRRARAAGVPVLTWDADGDADARSFTIVPTTAEALAQALAFEAGRMLGGPGEIAVITSTATAPNQKAWHDALTARLSREFPGVSVAETAACQDIEENAARETARILSTWPGVRAIVGLCAPAVPGAARARRESGRRDVRITGVSFPAACRKDIEEGWVDSLVTWSPRKLGYLAAWAAGALVGNELAPGALTLKAGRLGNVIVDADRVRLGRLHIVTRGNLHSFDD